MSKQDVTHRGVVVRSEPGRLVVRTSDERKCDGCAVVALCNPKTDGGSDSELLTVDCPEASHYAEGDKVALTASSTSTLLATWWALFLPALLFLGVIIGCRVIFPDSGGWSIAAGFALLALYWLFLYSQRRRFAQQIKWKVERE